MVSLALVRLHPGAPAGTAGPAPSADVDTYSFAAAAGDLLFLSLDSDPLRNGTPINATLALLVSAGMTLLSVNDSGSIFSTMSGAGSLAAGSPHSPAEALVYRVSTGGTFYAKVSIGTSSTGPTGLGDYLLSISKNGAIGAGGAPVLDIDLDGAYDALTDGLLVIRYLFGLTGTGLTNGATAPGAKGSIRARSRHIWPASIYSSMSKTTRRPMH